MSNSNRCLSINTQNDKINKQSSEYYCYSKGGALISIETKEKFNIIKNKLQNIQSN
jgi:hypothetical protein